MGNWNLGRGLYPWHYYCPTLDEMGAPLTYDLGKWFPELGPYDAWEVEKLREFAKRHVILKVDQCDTHTGGVLLLVDGYKKS